MKLKICYCNISQFSVQSRFDSAVLCTHSYTVKILFCYNTATLGQGLTIGRFATKKSLAEVIISYFTLTQNSVDGQMHDSWKSCTIVTNPTRFYSRFTHIFTHSSSQPLIHPLSIWPRETEIGKSLWCSKIILSVHFKQPFRVCTAQMVRIPSRFKIQRRSRAFLQTRKPTSVF